MSGTHSDHDQPAENARTLNKKNPSVLNSTKVVRLFVVDPKSGRSKEHILATEHPTRQDVFVFVTEDTITSERGISKPAVRLAPYSIGQKDVVDHDEAHKQHPHGSIPMVTRDDAEQIEWQCDVPFRVVRFERVGKEGEKPHGFENRSGPDEPFETPLKELREREGDRCTPIRSGPVRAEGAGGALKWQQLYKAHFELKIDGKWKPLDPDFVCGSGN